MDESVKARYDAWIASEMAEIWDISKYIHANPELGFQEEKACRIQCEYLKQKGFDILQSVYFIIFLNILYGGNRCSLTNNNLANPEPKLQNFCGKAYDPR